MGGRGSNSMDRLMRGGQAKPKTETKMPWETDPKYSGNMNAKIVWLMDHPQSKYNDPDFISGIKRIEGMADRGVSVAQRQKALKTLAKRFNMSEAEARHFIAPEFLR